MDTVESTLQRRASNLVDREVFACLSTLVSRMTELAPDDDDEILELWSGPVNYQDCAEANGWTKHDDGTIRESDDDDDDIPGDRYDTWEECCQEEDLDTSDYQSEVFEHWAVSNYLGQQLSERGETVVEAWGLVIWARTTTGQAIAIDHVIERIVAETGYMAG